MKIISIILDGFKSFRDRTVIKDLDGMFTSITGLNGSGKSNILDGIIFVLGLNSFTIARANNLRELIYKSGNAGITKASVTLVFSNTSKNLSPEGYRDSDTISITRTIKDDKTKYYVNGRITTNANVKFLFKSVSLDIENYFRFFVQQGTISKIVSFKPKEIYKLLEETAGISHYNKEDLDTEKMGSSKLKDISLFDSMVSDIEDRIALNIEKKENLDSYMETECEFCSKNRFYRAYQWYVLKDSVIET
jgi:structural maintenance of chromosome 2